MHHGSSGEDPGPLRRSSAMVSILIRLGSKTGFVKMLALNDVLSILVPGLMNKALTDPRLPQSTPSDHR